MLRLELVYKEESVHSYKTIDRYVHLLLVFIEISNFKDKR